MAVVALLTSGDRRIYALPGQLADVEMVYGGGYEDEDEEPGERYPLAVLGFTRCDADFNLYRVVCRHEASCRTASASIPTPIAGGL